MTPEPLPVKGAKKAGIMDRIAPVEPDPLADVAYSGDLETDAAAELDALDSAFRDRKRREARRFTQATDSEFWVAVCFESREQKEAFLAAFDVARFGDKYLDGRKVAAALGVNLEGK